ncbi:MAG: RDD family protein [Bullifex sp.]
MTEDIQRADIWKRISAGLFDFIMTGILAVLFIFILSALFGYNRANDSLQAKYSEYEEKHGIVFQITADEYGSYSPSERERWDAAYDDLIGDESVSALYTKVINLTLLMTTFGILLSFLVWEFAIPLMIGNGQTVGKKVFGICLMRTSSVRINALCLFIRTVLGKFTIETMISVYILIMISFSSIGVIGSVILITIPVLNLIFFFVKDTRPLIHDLLADTCVVDYASQEIFESGEALLEAKKALARERAEERGRLY